MLSNENHEMKMDSFDLSFFLSADDVMVAFAEGEHDENEERVTYIVLRYIETEGINWTRRVTENNENNWKTQFVMRKEVPRTSNNYPLRNPTATVIGGRIYFFSINFYVFNKSSAEVVIQDSELELAVGEIKRISTAQGEEKTIEWRNLDQQSSILMQAFRRELPYAILYWGSAFFAEDGKVVFILRAANYGQDVSLFINSNDIENMTEWEISHFNTPRVCHPPFFFWWGKELMMVLNECQDGSRTLKSNDMGRTWTFAEHLFTRLWDNLKSENDFTITTIENKTVLLFLQQIPKEEITGVKYETNLWLSDGNHLHNIGQVVSQNNYSFFGGLVYTKGELFYLSKPRGSGEAQKGILTHFEDKHEKIKFLLHTWDTVDKYLSLPCNKTNPRCTPPGTICATPVPTNGLVGFLSSGSGNDTYWHDEYFYANASVTGGRRVDNGFRFTGVGAGAKWHFGKYGEMDPYGFARYGLTVVATVTIHDALGNNTPLLTVGEGTCSTERQGLWYGRDRQWKVKLGNNALEEPAAGSWEANKTYSVALVLLGNSINTYVNGKYLAGYVLPKPIIEEKSLATLHLFIAGYAEHIDWKTMSRPINVTVANVLLYNQRLSEAEIRAIGNTFGGSGNRSTP